MTDEMRTIIRESAARITETCGGEELFHARGCALPERVEMVDITEKLRALLFPGFFGDVSTARSEYAAGYALTLDWDKVDGAFYFRGSKTGPQHTCGSKEFRNAADVGPLLEPYGTLSGGKRTWSNGTLTFKPDLSSDAFLAHVAAAENVAVANNAVRPKDPARGSGTLLLWLIFFINLALFYFMQSWLPTMLTGSKSFTAS